MAVINLVLNRNMHGGVANGIQWFECDTEAELPTSDINQGDIAYTKDSDKIWKRTATPAWVEIGAGGGSGLTDTIEFQDNTRRDHTVVIENGSIQSWTIV